MATYIQDPRELLAKMEAEEQAALAAAKRLQEENASKRKVLLEKLREEDLADVREKCKMHGFTATDLKGFLKMRANRKPKDPNAPKRKYTRRAKPEEQAS